MGITSPSLDKNGKIPAIIPWMATFCFPCGAELIILFTGGDLSSWDTVYAVTRYLVWTWLNHYLSWEVLLSRYVSLDVFSFQITLTK